MQFELFEVNEEWVLRTPAGIRNTETIPGEEFRFSEKPVVVSSWKTFHEDTTAGQGTSTFTLLASGQSRILVEFFSWKAYWPYSWKEAWFEVVLVEEDFEPPQLGDAYVVRVAGDVCEVKKVAHPMGV